MTARAWRIAVAVAFVAIAIFAARPVATPGPFLRDFEAYWSAGVTRNAGHNPYTRAIWDAERSVPGVDPSRDEVLPFVGPPASLFVWADFALFPYAVAARIWWVLLAVCVPGLAMLTLRGSGSPIAFTPVAAAVVLAIGFGPVTSDLALGQVALLALTGAVAFALVTAVPKGLWPLVAGTVAAHVALLQPNVAIELTSQMGRARAALALVGGVTTSYLLGAFLHGWDWPLIYGQVLMAHGAAERFSAIQISPAAIAYGFGASAQVATLVAWSVAAIAVAAAGALAYRIRDSFARFAVFAALAPFVVGFFHEHDLIVAYVAAVWCALRTHGRTRTIACAGAVLVAVDWLGLAQRPSGLLQSVLLAGTALLAFSALGDDEKGRATLYAAGPLAVIFALAALLAASHTAPVWPDTLASFHAPASATLSQIWFEEQRAAGLLAAVPAWAVLRSLSLLGCALLVWSVARASFALRLASLAQDDKATRLRSR
jgi:hypothetical protein